MAGRRRVRLGHMRVLPGGLAAAILAACLPAGPSPTVFAPGTAASPRPVILIARDYLFEPSVVDLVPGETVVFQVIDGGLVVHEAILGPDAVQDAWEAAEALAADPPPGPTPLVSVAPDVTGVRIVVASGERVDRVWTVPLALATPSGDWVIGCHIPGHWAKGMVVPIRFVDATGSPLPTTTR